MSKTDKEHNSATQAARDVFNEKMKAGVLALGFTLVALFSLNIIAASLNRHGVLMVLGVAIGLAIVVSSLRYAARNASILFE